jgi:hypothetical protein
MIEILQNKELDYEVYADFWDFSVAGANFAELIKKDHPGINQDSYKKYIDGFYAENHADLDSKQRQINSLLSEKQDVFFSEVEKIFKIDFSDSKFQGYLSIFDCNPRWIDTRTFQVHYKRDLDSTLAVILHEVLHFAFFEYLDKNFSKEIDGLSKDSGKIWELSEIINVIVLNLPAFKEITGREEKLFYPDLKVELDKAQEIWTDSGGNVDVLISHFLKKSI